MLREQGRRHRITKRGRLVRPAGRHDSRQFCFKYNIPEVSKTALSLCRLCLPYFLTTNKPLTVRITHSELSEESTLDFMVEGLDTSPLRMSGLSAVPLEDLRALCRDIVEEPTSRGFRVKMLI